MQWAPTPVWPFLTWGPCSSNNLLFNTARPICSALGSEVIMLTWLMGHSVLYKSRFKHTIHLLLFSLLHPSLRSMLPWVMVQYNQHIVASFLSQHIVPQWWCPGPHSAVLMWRLQWTQAFAEWGWYVKWPPYSPRRPYRNLLLQTCTLHSKTNIELVYY